MIKLEFREISESPKVTKSNFSREYPLPFSITIGHIVSLPATIYARNFHGGNLIEFRFDENDQALYEINILAIESASVESRQFRSHIHEHGVFYACLIQENESQLDESSPVKVTRDTNSICIDWIGLSRSALNYFAIAKGCYVGIDDNSIMSSVILEELSETEMVDILG